MNALFGISKDADILSKPLANRDEIEAFENEVGHGPVAPYLPDLYHVRGTWNHALLLVFMEEYTKKFMIEDEDDQDDITQMFMDRMFRLRRKVKQVMRLPGETDVQLGQRYLAKHKRILKEQRRNSRRNEVS